MNKRYLLSMVAILLCSTATKAMMEPTKAPVEKKASSVIAEEALCELIKNCKSATGPIMADLALCISKMKRMNLSELSHAPRLQEIYDAIKQTGDLNIFDHRIQGNGESIYEALFIYAAFSNDDVMTDILFKAKAGVNNVGALKRHAKASDKKHMYEKMMEYSKALSDAGVRHFGEGDSSDSDDSDDSDDDSIDERLANILRKTGTEN